MKLGCSQIFLCLLLFSFVAGFEVSSPWRDRDQGLGLTLIPVLSASAFPFFLGSLGFVLVVRFLVSSQNKAKPES